MLKMIDTSKLLRTYKLTQSSLLQRKRVNYWDKIAVFTALHKKEDKKEESTGVVVIMCLYFLAWEE